jgi:hypothetical protein
MYEVIIERPRGGSGWGRPWPRLVPWRLYDHDDDGACDGGSTKVRMGPRGRTKWLNENLAPLRRFLLSRLGRQWDAVYGEICAHISLDSAVQKHVLLHLHQYVEKNPVFINGWPHHPIAGGKQRNDYRPLRGWGHDFFVCPETGQLRVVRKRRQRQSDPR